MGRELKWWFLISNSPRTAPLLRRLGSEHQHIGSEATASRQMIVLDRLYPNW
jgi:hypothetical protein